MRIFTRPILIGLIGVSLLFAASAASAQDIVTDDDVNEVASQLFCPTCESIPVDVCPTEVCQDWRSEIRSQLEDGRSDQEILNYFADRYGEGVLANPPPRGFGLVIWIAPFAILLIGAFFFFNFLQQLRSTAAPAAVSSPIKDVRRSSTSENRSYVERIEDELNQR